MKNMIQKKLKFEVFMCNGIKGGDYKSYHSNGQINVKCNYISGKLHGEYIEYYTYEDDGLYRRGILNKKENICKKICTYINDILNKEYSEYYSH